MSNEDAGTELTPEQVHEARIAEADAMLMVEPKEAAEGEATEEPTEAAEGVPEGEQEASEEEPAEAKADAEQEEEKKEEAEDKPDDVPTKARVMQMKRYRQQAERKLAEIQQLEEQLARREDALKEQSRAMDLLSQKLRNDPLGAVDDLAARAGLDSHQVYERMTRRQLNNGAPDVSELHQELHSLREEIAQERVKRAKQEQEQLQQIREQTIERNIAQDSGVIANIGSSDQANQYPYLSALPAKEVQQQARTIIRTVLDTGMQMSLEQIAGFIDNEAKQRYEQLSRALSSKGDGHPIGGNGSGQGSQAQDGAKLGKRSRKPRAVSNAHAAETSGSARELSHAEKMARADELLRSLVPSGE